MELSQEFNYLRPFRTELVRVGPDGDCGYLIPIDVAKTTNSLYSIGISTNWEFEIEMAKLNQRLTISAFDRTSGWQVFGYLALRDLFRGDPSELGPQSLKVRINSALRYISLCVRFRLFFVGRRKFHRLWIRGEKVKSDEISFKQSLSNVFKNCPTMLKVDIEGGEYEFVDEFISQVSKNLELINCIILEVHDTETRRNEFEKLVKGISQYFPIVHIHGNNCAGVAADGLPEVLEITFASAGQDYGSRNFPLVGQDFPNDSKFPDIDFSFAESV